LTEPAVQVWPFAAAMTGAAACFSAA
jgi:hypothetical protein